MQRKHFPKRLTAGLMSLIMLLTLLPAMSTPAAAANDLTFTVQSAVNNSASFVTATQNPMSETNPTKVVLIPPMYQGKQQTILVTASKAVTWSVILGDQPDWMTLTQTDTEWKLTVPDPGKMPDSVNGSFLLKGTPTDGSESREIWIYYYCFSESMRPKVTTDSLPRGNVGSSYYAQLDFTGNYSGWANWEIVSDKLPDGLTINYNLTLCEITGTPMKAGTYNFGVQVTTISGTSETRNLSIVIEPKMVAPQLSGADLPYAVVGQEYTGYDLKTLLTNSDYYPATISGWKWYTGDALPSGLSIDSDTGLLSGTVAETVVPKNYRFVVECTNGLGAASGKLELPVYQVPVINETVAVQPAAKAGDFFSWTPLTAGDKMSSALWSAEGLPAGLHCGSINGDIYGTPTEAGTFSVTVKRSIPGITLKTTKVIELTVAPDRRFGLNHTSGYSFPSATASEGSYVQPAAKTFSVTGKGHSPVTLKVALSGTNASAFTLGGTTDGTLNKGSTMAFTVQPKAGLAAGEYTATVTVSDTEDAANKLEFTVKFQVSDRRVTPTVTNGYDNLPYAVAGQTYTYQFNASGTPPYTWKLWKGASDSAPAGMTIDSDGLLTWTVPADHTGGQVTFYVTADPDADSVSTSGYEYCYFQVYRPVEIQLQTTTASSAGSFDYTGTSVAGESDRILLPEGYVDRSYDRDYQNNSVSGYRLSISTNSTADKIFVEGELPDGMRLHTNDEYTETNKGNSGRITGNPEKAGTYDFTIVAKKYSGDTLVSEARQKVRLIIHEKFTLSAGSFGDLGFEVGKPLSINLSRFASGGKAPYKFSTTSDLPAGLELLSDGTLTGTPKECRQGFNFWLEVMDDNEATVSSASMSFGWINLPPLELTAPDTGATFIDEISVGLSEAYKSKFTAGNYTLSYRWKVEDKLSYSNASVWQNMSAYTDTIKLSADTINDKLNEWNMALAAGDKVTLNVELSMTGTAIQKTKEITFTKVNAPTPPTASPYEAGKANTFVGATSVQLLATTSGGGVGIRYTTNGSDPTTGGIEYTGKPIMLSDTTTIKACCYIVSGTSTVYSDVAEFTYTKTAGVAVSGTVKSYGSASDAVTVTLTKSGETAAAYTAALSTATGTAAPYTQTYSFTAVTPGEYTLRVEKKGHAPWTETITVDTSNITGKDVTVYLWGDVDLNGTIEMVDAFSVFDHTNPFSEVDLSGVALTLADVDGDGVITMTDAIYIFDYTNPFSDVTKFPVEDK